jgi:hypothetical protein
MKEGKFNARYRQDNWSAAFSLQNELKGSLKDASLSLSAAKY